MLCFGELKDSVNAVEKSAAAFALDWFYALGVVFDDDYFLNNVCVCDRTAMLSLSDRSASPQAQTPVLCVAVSGSPCAFLECCVKTVWELKPSWCEGCAVCLCTMKAGALVFVYYGTQRGRYRSGACLCQRH